MSFIVRILFTGMMVFIPNENRTQVDVLLLNVPHGHTLSDGTALSHHKPLVIARAGNCTGTCPTNTASIASYLYHEQPTDVAKASLEAAVADGGAWEISGSDITIRKGSETDPDLPALEIVDGVRTTLIPTTSAERRDLTWLASLNEICPTCGVDDDVLDTIPPSSTVAARFRLNTGSLYTYSVARIGTNVTPVHFKRLDGTCSASSYTQAIASWIGADIEVEGDSIELVETKYDNSTGRTMKLEPDENDRVEIAVLNLPTLVPVAPSGTPGVGKHFERYYDITANPPSNAARLVPQPGAAPGTGSYSQVSWTSVHPMTDLASDLLSALRLNIDRSAYEVVLCPPASPNFP